LFENVLLETSHSFATEIGVGRFCVGSKSTLMLHDVDLCLLISGPDKERMKSICRTEPTSAKIHSTTTTVPPVFVFVSSNQHLMDHTFPTEFKTGLSASKISKANVNTKGACKEDIDAVKNRFIEIFVRKRPNVPLEFLPSYGNFNRKHFINGTYELVLNMLLKYKKTDFASPYMYLYPLMGLAKNIHVLPPQKHHSVKTLIYNVVMHYQLEEEEKMQINSILPLFQNSPC